MILKSCLIASCLIAAPVALVSATQGPAPRDSEGGIEAGSDLGSVSLESGGSELRSEVERLRTEVERLRAEAERSGVALAEANARAEQAVAELREALDMLLQGNERRERSCAPSRRLLTQHEWLHRRGHNDHAKKVIDLVVAQHRNSPNRLNQLTWALLTDDELAGQFDATAFVVAQRMQACGRKLDHRQLDTVALAYFLNGHAQDAVAIQRKALAEHDDSSYRRRLRTYEAAMAALQKATAGERGARSLVVVDATEAVEADAAGGSRD